MIMKNNVSYNNQNQTLTMGYMRITFLEGKPVAYERVTGTVFYLEEVVTREEMQACYPSVHLFRGISQKDMDKGLVPILLAELGLWNLHQIEPTVWSGT